MPRATIELPSLLCTVSGAEPSLDVDAGTLRAALDALLDAHPTLGVHLFDETGGFRQHVLCLHNGRSTRFLDSLDVPIAEGDTVTILQAVSGG
jgi:molybdopterin converting factor small subunit